LRSSWITSGALIRRPHVLSDIALRSAELQVEVQAISVDGGIDVRRISLETRADDPADLAMRINTFADEFHSRARSMKFPFIRFQRK
jgi:hypothetical protein